MASDKNTRPDLLDLMVPLRRYARSLTRDALRADDLVHDTLVRALEMQGTLRPNTNLRTWMMTVLHNAFIDEQREREEDVRLENGQRVQLVRAREVGGWHQLSDRI